MAAEVINRTEMSEIDTFNALIDETISIDNSTFHNISNMTMTMALGPDCWPRTMGFEEVVKVQFGVIYITIFLFVIGVTG